MFGSFVNWLKGFSAQYLAGEIRQNDLENHGGCCRDVVIIDSSIDLQRLSDLLRDHHLHVTGATAAKVQEVLVEEDSRLIERLSPLFHRVVILDALTGQAGLGKFQIQRFLRHVAEMLATAFGNPSNARIFHPELISQTLKDEPPSLFCFVNVQALSESDLHKLRGLGFTQDQHRVIYCGDNRYLAGKTLSIGSGETRVSASGIDDNPSAFEQSVLPVEMDSELAQPVQPLESDSASWTVFAKPEVKLAALLEISNSLAQTLSVEQILPKLLDSLFKIFVQADRGFVVMRPKPDGPLMPVAVKSRRPGDDERMRISRTIIEEAMKSRKAILAADAPSDERFGMDQSIADFSIRSMICAPMIGSDGQPLGVIQIDTLNQDAHFTDEDLEVLAGVASQAAVALDNATMHEQVVAQRAMQRDLELARRMQRTLLPSKPPQVPGYFFFDYYQAARQVGGDYYDYVPLPGGRFAVIVGDVAGKGVPAALTMARLSADVRFSLVSEEDPAKAIQQINDGFARHDWQDRFVTLIASVVNPRTNELMIVNAGHILPFLRRSGGRVVEIGEEVAGLPLGVSPGYEYQSYTHVLDPGDVIAIFTDGFSEAMNSDRELYGLERLAKQLAGSTGSVQQIANAILEDVNRFVGGFDQSDDMCLVCFGREH